jgi:two-component system chemotaxis sensor kinase CheA
VLIHAVRNAVDHGVQSEADRVAAGKRGTGTLHFAALRGDGTLTIAVGDDGPGIDWDAMRRRAEKAGLPHATDTDLVEALFADGVSTREQATDTSGRGVGMGALRYAVRELGGTISIESAPGQGTAFRFTFPHADAQILPMRPPTQPIRIHG